MRLTTLPSFLWSRDGLAMTHPLGNSSKTSNPSTHQSPAAGSWYLRNAHRFIKDFHMHFTDSKLQATGTFRLHQCVPICPYSVHVCLVQPDNYFLFSHDTQDGFLNSPISFFGKSSLRLNCHFGFLLYRS